MSSTVIRTIDFIYSSSIAYDIELGNEYMRFFYDDEVITDDNDEEVWISSPYQTSELFELHVKQIADVMRITHPNHKPRLLKRVSATAFQLDEIPHKTGPFLTRNDLIDPDVTETAFMTSSVVAKDAEGTLTCDNGETGGNQIFASYFASGHVGALFKLVHTRTDTIVEQSGVGTSEPIDVKGTFNFNTHGTWAGTVKLQRRENSTSDNDWEDYRTYIGNKDKNIQYAGTENADSVEYRILAETGMSAAFRADITINETLKTGIVRITAVNSESEAAIVVIKELDGTNGTNATRRWAEGAWSD